MGWPGERIKRQHKSSSSPAIPVDGVSSTLATQQRLHQEQKTESTTHPCGPAEARKEVQKRDRVTIHPSSLTLLFVSTPPAFRVDSPNHMINQKTHGSLSIRHYIPPTTQPQVRASSSQLPSRSAYRHTPTGPASIYLYPLTRTVRWAPASRSLGLTQHRDHR